MKKAATKYERKIAFFKNKAYLKTKKMSKFIDLKNLIKTLKKYIIT